MTITPPNRIVIDFLEGITNRSDAIAYARGFISSHFDVPQISGYYVQPYKGGFAYEVHEGGSRKAFLPGILRTLAENPDTTLSIRSGTRVLQVSKGQRDSFNSILLPEELSSYLENVMETDERAPSLISFQMDNIVWLFSGATLGLIGGLIFTISLGFYALDPNQNKVPDLNVLTTEKLPLAQWHSMMAQLNGGNYISAMRFQNGQWHFETKPVSGRRQNAPSMPENSNGISNNSPSSERPELAVPVPPMPNPDTAEKRAPAPSPIQPPGTPP